MEKFIEAHQELRRRGEEVRDLLKEEKKQAKIRTLFPKIKLERWGILPVRRVKKSSETVYLCECAGEVRKNKLDTNWWICQDCKRQYNESVLEIYCELIEEE